MRSRLSKMARYSAVWPCSRRAARTSRSVFQSSVASSAERSWSMVVGAMASNRARTLSFFFTLRRGLGSKENNLRPRVEVERDGRVAWRRRNFDSKSIYHLFRPFELAGEEIIHDEGGE